MPERAHLAELDAEAARLAAEVDQHDTRRHELLRSQRRLEDEVTSVRQRIEHENTRLYSGEISAPRELQDIQDEIASLGRRATQIEDEVLEYMEQIEPLESRLAELAESGATVDRSRQDVAGHLAEAEAEIDAERAGVQQARAELDASIADTALVAEYERQRAGRDGIGVARLVGSNCGGCHLALSAVEIDRLKHAPPGTIGQCEECGRMLVP